MPMIRIAATDMLLITSPDRAPASASRDPCAQTRKIGRIANRRRGLAFAVDLVIHRRMNQPLTPPEAHRDSVGGRVTFGLSAFAFLAVLLALLDRVGAPERLVSSLGPLAAICGLAAVGLILRCMRVSRFYAAGRAMPAPYAGLALAALFIGLFAPFLPPAPNGAAVGDVALGFGVGATLAALVTGPLLRKTGAFSLPDLLVARFPDLALRLGVIAVVCVASYFVAAAAFETAVRGLQMGLLMERRGAVALAAAGILLIALPGGLSGVVWSAMGAGVILLAGLGLPIAIMISRGDQLPLPGLGDSSAWSDALGRLAAWTPGAPVGSNPVVVFALAIGVGALAPLLAPLIATRDRAAAHAAGRRAILWTLLIGVLLAVSLAAAALATNAAVVGQRPDQLPTAIYQASARGLVTICGRIADTPPAALAACEGAPGYAGAMRAQDIAAHGAFLLTALPNLRGFGEAFVGLDAAGGIVVALALAAAAFQALATALGHDAIYRLRSAGALTSSRLAITRALLLVAVVATAAALFDHSVNAREMIGLAIAFSAAAIAPLLILTFWPRATAVDALFALLCGLAAAEASIVLGGGRPTLESLSIGSTIACLVGAGAGFISSLFRTPDPLRGGGAFFDRVLHGYGDVVDPDKGA